MGKNKNNASVADTTPHTPVGTVPTPDTASEKPAVDIKRVKRDIIVGFCKLQAYILAVATDATRGKKAERIGFGAALQALDSKPVSAWYALLVAHKDTDNAHFSADDIRTATGVDVNAKNADGVYANDKARGLVGMSLGAFYAYLTKSVMTRGTVLAGLRQIAKNATLAD